MHPTRQVWAVGLLAGVLAALAVVFARPLLLTATVSIGAWILVRQYHFISAVNETVSSMAVTQSPAATEIRTDESTPIMFEATLEDSSALSLSLEAGVPTAGAIDEPLTLSLNPGETRDQRLMEVQWPVAGRHQFEQATVTATDGLFEATLAVGSEPTVTVEPRGPQTTHVGKGGDRMALAQGDHESGRLGSGIDPAELREYVPGDAADKIDWKATARLDTLHIREFEAQTNRPTMLIVDHRGTLSVGPRAETKLTYIRDVALATAASARRLDDPLGLVTVGDAGITSRFDPTTGPGHYLSVRRRLLDLEPTDASRDSRTTNAGGDGHRATGVGIPEFRSLTSISRSHGVAAELTDRADTFARTLEPFYAHQRYEARFDSDPLLGAVRTASNQRHDRIWIVICTDDSNPKSLYEAVLHARAKDNEIMVLLTPSVLFTPGGLTDVERAYDRYQSFEMFRQKLDQMDNVTALEVAPNERLSSILGAGRERAQTRGEL